MEERKNPFRNIKVVVRPSTPMLKIIVILVILFSMAALAALSWVQSGIRARTEEIQAEAAELEYENEILNEKIDQLDSVQSAEDIAQEELGMVYPDTVIIDPTS
jgi:cell division protein FtsB